MAENRVQIVITADGRAVISEIGRVEGGFSALRSRTTSDMDRINANTSAMVNGLRAAYVAAQALAGALATRKIVDSAIEYNQQMESSRIGIATILMAQGEFLDGQDRMVSGAEKFSAAIRMSSELMQQLEQDNLATMATLDQLVRAFQQTLAPGLSVEFSVDQVRQYTLAMIQAASAMQISLDMMAEETRSMLRGTITPRNTLIASALGVTNQDIARYKNDAQGLFDYVMGKMVAFGQAGIAIQSTYAGLLSNFKDLTGKALGTATLEFFERTKKILADLINYAGAIDKTTGKWQANPEFESTMRTINALLLAMLEAAENVGRAIHNIGDRAEWAAIRGIVSQIDLSLRAMGEIRTPLSGQTAAQFQNQVQQYIQMLDAARQQLQEAVSSDRMTGLDLLSAADARAQIWLYTSALETLRENMRRAGVSTQDLDQYIASLSRASRDAGSGAGDAADGMDQLRYKASGAGASAEELAEKLKILLKVFADIERGSARLGQRLAGDMLEADIKLSGLRSGWDPGRISAEIDYRKKLAEIMELRSQMRDAGMSDVDILGDTSRLQDQAANTHSKQLEILRLEEWRRESIRAGRITPVGYEDINQAIDQLRSKVIGLSREYRDLQYDFEVALAGSIGQGLTAEEIEIDKWMAGISSRVYEQIRQVQQQYREMSERLTGKRGASAEAAAEVAAARAELDEAWRTGLQQIELAERMANLKKVVARSVASENTAQLAVEHARLTGTIEDQLRVQLALIAAERERRIASAETAEQQDLIRRIYEEQARLVQLRATGSAWDGFVYAAEQWQKNLPTAADRGMEAFQALERAITSAADALTEFTMTGQLSFTDFANSIIRDLVRIMYQALLTDAVSGIFRMIGISGPGVTTGRFGVESYAGIGGGYGSGGIARGPQLAWVGEGGYNEAVVPLPDGRSIPVTLAGSSGTVINVQAPVQVTVSGRDAGVGSADSDASSRMGREVGRAARAEIVRIVEDLKRSGGALNPVRTYS